MDLQKLNNLRVLITGGMGFIGSNLCRALIELGAKVTVLDASLPEQGANKFNFKGIEDKIEFVQGDVRDEELIEKTVQGKNFIFDLAAQANYLKSSEEPLLDLDINCKSKLILLEACRKHNKEVKIVFTSSRMVYGKIESIPVTERHPTNPLSLYGIHKLTAEKYFINYFQNFGIRSSVIRIPNPYGPRQQVKHSSYGIVGWFVRLALDNETIKVFGDGSQIRDYLYIDDLVDAMLVVAVSDKTDGKVYNVGSGRKTGFKEMADTIVDVAGSGKVELTKWPDDYEKNETGDYVADISKLQKDTGWETKVSFKDGAEKTVEFYKKNKQHYW